MTVLQASPKDIEDLAVAGKNAQTCPYYGSRGAIPQAEVCWFDIRYFDVALIVYVSLSHCHTICYCRRPPERLLA